MNANTLTTVAILAVLAASPIQAAHFDDVDRSEIQQAGLDEINSRYFDEVFMSDIAEIEGATRVYIAELDTREVQFDELIVDRMRPRHDWYLTDADHEWLRAQYRESLVEAIEAAGDYEIVDQPGADTLNITAQLVELAPLAPRDDFRSRDAFTTYYSEGTGDLTIAIEVARGADTVVALIDKRKAGRSWEKNDAFHSRRNVMNVFDRWARNLTVQLGMN